MKPTLDLRGLVVHSDGDQGDCFADTFRYVYGTWLNKKTDWEVLEAAKQHLFPIAGIGIRHPDRWNDPCDLSRDQQTPAVICLEAVDELYLLGGIEQRHRERRWRYQNIDWASAEHRNYYHPKQRTLEGDKIMLANAAIRVTDSYLFPEDSVGRDINFIMSLLQVGINGHSKYTEQARDLYRKRRNGPVWALEHYHRNDNPVIAALWKPHVERLIMGKT